MKLAPTFLALALLALPGCGLTLDYDPPTDAGVPLDAPRMDAATDAGPPCGGGCPSGRVCVDDVCRATCTGSVCSDDPTVCEACVGGVCLPADPTCAGGSACATAACDPMVDQCRVTSTCAAGMACVGDTCVAATCSGDADCLELLDECGQPYVCNPSSGTCEPALRDICAIVAGSCSVPDPCTCLPTGTVDPSLCAADELCDPETERCVECLAPSDCPAGQTCEPSRLECVECAENSDCPSGLVCDPASFTCVECIDITHCPDFGTTFCDPTTHECVECLGNVDCALAGTLSLFCEGGTCVECRTSADCERSRPVCQADGTCGPCNADGDCGVGSRCVAGACQLRDCTLDSDCPSLGCATGDCTTDGTCALVLDDAYCGAGGLGDDHVACTHDACAPSGLTRDGCVHTPDDGFCADDGFECTTERCSARVDPGGADVEGCVRVRNDSFCARAAGALGCAISVCAGGEPGAVVDPNTGCGLTYEPSRCGLGRICEPSGQCNSPPRCGFLIGECPDDGIACNGHLTCLLGTCTDTLDLGLDRCTGTPICQTYCSETGCSVRTDPPAMLMCSAVAIDTP